MNKTYTNSRFVWFCLFPMVFVISAIGQQTSVESRIQAQNASIRKLQRFVMNIQQNFYEKQISLIDSLGAANRRAAQLEAEVAELNKRFVSSVVIDSLTSDYLRRTEHIKESLNFYFAVLATILLVGTVIVVLVIRKTLHRYTEGEHSPVGQMQVFVDNIKTAITPEAVSDSDMEKENNGGEIDHELPVRVAEEVFRMRARLSRMPEETKGLAALLNAVNRLEDELNIKGYTLIDMTGQPYSDEMTVSVKEFVPQDDLPAGERRILRMIKPQVRYGSHVVSYGECEVAMSSEDLAQR